MPLSRRTFVVVSALGLLSKAGVGAPVLRSNMRTLGRLPNGLAYHVLCHPAARKTTVYMVYGSGCRHDPPEAQGTAHMLEHALFRATDVAGRIFDAQFMALGLNGEAFTTEDITAYHCVAPEEHVPAVLGIEAARMVTMTLSQEALAVEKNVVLAEIAAKDADFLLNQRLTAAVMHGTAYANQLAGVPEQVERLTVSNLQDFHAQHYAPGNAVVVLVGPAPVATMEAWIAAAFSTIDKPFAGYGAHAQWKHEVSSRHPVPARPTHLALSWPGLRTAESALGAFWDTWPVRVLGSDVSAFNLCYEQTGRLVLSAPRNSETVERQAAALSSQLARALRRANDAVLQGSLKNAVELSLRLKRQHPSVLAEQQVQHWQTDRTPLPVRQSTPLAQLQTLLQAPPDIFLV